MHFHSKVYKISSRFMKADVSITDVFTLPPETLVLLLLKPSTKLMYPIFKNAVYASSVFNGVNWIYAHLRAFSTNVEVLIAIY